MSGSSTASSSPPGTGFPSVDRRGGRWMQDDGLNTGRVEDFMDIQERAGLKGSGDADASGASDPPSARHGEAATSAQTSPFQGTIPSGRHAPIDLTRPMPSHTERDRKRRLTSTGEHTRLQRTRSGEGPSRDAPRPGAQLPHRSVSMVVPSSRDTSTAVPGSSYDMAIDITSSPPGAASRPSYQDSTESSWDVPGAPRFSAIARTLTASSEAASGSLGYPNEEATPSFSRPYSWNGPELMDAEAENRQCLAGNADLVSPRPDVTAHQYGNAFHRGNVGSYEGSQSSRRYDNAGFESTRLPRGLRKEHYPQLAPGFGPRLNEEISPSTRVYQPGRQYPVQGHQGTAPEVIPGISDAYGPRSPSTEYLSRRASNRSGWHHGEQGEFDEMVPPRWQPDAEVTECPICGTVFNFWYRKHHCRKCGRVVCAACSPHRITIPRQFIVRPPDSTALPTSSPVPLPRPILDLTGDDSISSFTINPALGGGEEVRLCNPCVPDPNPNPPGYATLRPHGHRSTHSLSSTMGNVFSPDARENRSGRQERRTVGANDRPSFLRELGQQVRQNMYDTIPNAASQELEIRRARRASAQAGAASTGVTTTRVAPPPTQPPRPPAVSERDLCPVCGQRFPPISEDQPLESREAHVRHCIENFGAAAPQQEASVQPEPAIPDLPSAVARMVEFKATEKDCLGDNGQIAECTICMEDYEVGQQLARLQCFCKFHKTCISDWFERKRECPVHKPF